MPKNCRKLLVSESLEELFRVCGGDITGCVASPLCPFTKVQWRDSSEALNQAEKDEWLRNNWFVCMFWALRISWLIVFLFGFGY